MIDPPERRGAEGRFGGLWQFGGVRGVGTRDWAARVSLRGERGCASEPVAREGRAGRGVGGGRRRVRRPERGPGGPKSREIGPRFFRNGPNRRGSFINFSEA